MTKKEEIKDLLNENIIGLLGLEALPDEEKLSLLNKMSELVWKRVLLRIMERFSEEEARELEAILNDEEKVFQYLSDKSPDFLDILKEEIVKIKAEMVEVAKS